MLYLTISGTSFTNCEIDYAAENMDNLMSIQAVPHGLLESLPTN